MDTVEVKAAEKGRVFTIELNSSNELRRVNVPNGSQRILLEGTIGVLKNAEFVEDAVLELVGTGGVLSVDLSPGDLSKYLLPGRKETSGT